MIILTIKTDSPKAELALYEDTMQIGRVKWEAHRQLAATIHKKIDELLRSTNKTLNDLEAMVCFKGPGSFTGLRIGISAANALSYGLRVPIISANGDSWAQKGISGLLAGKSESIALPKYDRPAIVSRPTK